MHMLIRPWQVGLPRSGKRRSEGHFFEKGATSMDTVAILVDGGFYRCPLSQDVEDFLTPPVEWAGFFTVNLHGISLSIFATGRAARLMQINFFPMLIIRLTSG